MLLWFSRGKKALSIAGLDADEDSRFLAANLAILFSQLGENTLLVDTNLRNPRQHEIFGMKQSLGLSDVLSKRAGLEVIVSTAHFEKLSLLTAGTVPPNPQELVGSAAFTALYEILAHRYDVILYDVAPLKLGADALSIAATTGGGMLMAVRRDDARVADIHAVNRRLGTSGVDIVGAVLLES